MEERGGKTLMSFGREGKTLMSFDSAKCLLNKCTLSQCATASCNYVLIVRNAKRWPQFAGGP